MINSGTMAAMDATSVVCPNCNEPVTMRVNVRQGSLPSDITFEGHPKPASDECKAALKKLAADAAKPAVAAKLRGDVEKMMRDATRRFRS